MQARHAEPWDEHAAHAYTRVTAAKASDMSAPHKAGMATTGRHHGRSVAERPPIRTPSQAQTVDSLWRTYIEQRFAEVQANRFCGLRWVVAGRADGNVGGVYINTPYIINNNNNT